MNEKIKIELGSVQETLVIPLFARNLVNEVFPFYYVDPSVKNIIEKIDYDFSNLKKQGESTFYRFGVLEACMREVAMKSEIEAFLNEHPTGNVINLGCGLDFIGENLDNGKRKLYNIDFPDTIELRNKLTEPNERTINISSDLNDYSWINQIEKSNDCLFIAAGVFYYFYYEQVKSLVLEISKSFSSWKIVFDVAGKKATELMNKTYLKDGSLKGNAKALFYLKKPIEEISAWSSLLKVTSKGYMRGYIDVCKDKRIKGLYKFLAKLCDGPMKMKIVAISNH